MLPKGARSNLFIHDDTRVIVIVVVEFNSKSILQSDPSECHHKVVGTKFLYSFKITSKLFGLQCMSRFSRPHTGVGYKKILSEFNSATAITYNSSTISNQ